MSIVIPDTLDALLVPINSVRPDPSNVMQHPPSQIDALAASLVAFGFDQPILARRNGLIIAGHGRLLAARQVGMTHVPVVYTDLDGVDAARRMVGDNRLAALAEPDTEALAELLRQLQAEDALGGTGYDDAAVDALLQSLTAASDGEWAAAFGGVPDGEKSPFEQMTFTLATHQAETVREALRVAKEAGPFVDTGNENSNGNALARICEAYRGRG